MRTGHFIIGGLILGFAGHMGLAEKTTSEKGCHMKIVVTEKAPAAIGPYSQAVQAGGFLFCSGQIGIDPATGKLAGADVESQTRQVLANMQQVLAAAGASLSDVAKTTIYLQDMQDFSVVNGLYSAAFGDHKPARATVQVAGLPLGARVEIECVAVIAEDAGH